MNTTIIFPEDENEQTVLGLDMGSNSIGWFLQTVSANGMPKKIIAAGSRIFDNSRDPKTRVPLSVQKTPRKRLIYPPRQADYANQTFVQTLEGI